MRELNSIMRDSPEIAIMKSNKDAFIQMIKDNYKAKTENFIKILTISCLV